jgi:hypothetical protein
VVDGEQRVSTDPLQETLLHVRRLLLDLERHLDRAAEAGDLTEVGRAWARSAQVERTLRAVVPPEIMELAKAQEEDTDTRETRRPGTPP